MRKALKDLLAVFGELHSEREALQEEFAECLRSFYNLGRKKRLTARAWRGQDGLIHAVYLVTRQNGSITHGPRSVGILRHLRGRINKGVVYHIARDYSNLELWMAADAVRARLNGRSAAFNLAARDLRFALANRFSHRATQADRATAYTVTSEVPFIIREDAGAVLGAVVYDRLLSELEDRITLLIREWKKERQDLPFEPLVRWREGETLRVTWSFVERFYDSTGLLQVRSTDIPGGVTDRWLRRQPTLGSARRRKAVLRYAKALRLLLREYSGLLVWAGRIKAKVHATLHAEAARATPSEERGVG